MLTPSPNFPRGFSAERHEHRLREAAEREEAAWYEFIRTEPLDEGLCYFIGCDEGLVKIGYSRRVKARLKSLQSNAIYKLYLLATCRGGRTAEMHYHRKFKEHAVGGEWFTRCPEIEAEIERINAVMGEAK